MVNPKNLWKGRTLARGFFSFALIGIGLKLTLLLDVPLYLSFFPNVIDMVTIIGGGVFLFYEAFLGKEVCPSDGELPEPRVDGQKRLNNS